MSSYTMELRTYIESFTQYDEGLSIRERIEKGREHLFDFPYPIFNEDYRKVFETNIIRNFYMREIGFETEELFKFRLETWLQINMPYFNRMFESELIEFDPLINSEMETTHNQTNEKIQQDVKNREAKTDSTQKSKDTGESNQKSHNKGLSSGGGNQNTKSDNKDDDFSRKVHSDTPDNRLRLQTQEGKGVIEYASDIEEIKTNNKGTANSTTAHNYHGATNDDGTLKNEYDTEQNTDLDINTNETNNLDSNINELEDFIQHRAGKIGVVSYSKLMMEYRDSLVRIEKMIHREMQELFMLVY